MTVNCIAGGKYKSARSPGADFELHSDGHLRKKNPQTLEINMLTELIYLACSQKPAAICYL